MIATILVVEDDSSVRSLITTTLGTYGYMHMSAADGMGALKTATDSTPDIYIIDLGLPDVDGVDVIKKLRTWTDAPIIVVSARSETSDKIEALDAGADDYLTKPFSVEELLARIRVAIRKMSYDGSQRNDPRFVNGDLIIDYPSGCVYVAGREVHLTRTEYDLLCLLAKNAGKILTRNYILNEVWKTPMGNDFQSLRVFMATLRKKIQSSPDAPEQIQTHVGIGYRLMRIGTTEEN